MRSVVQAAAAVLGLVAAAIAARAQAPAFAPRDEQPEQFAAGTGREETFCACSGCHGFKLVAAQGLTREQWDESMAWMTKRHNMPDIQGADRDLILDYLAAHYPPRAPSRAGGFRNPFAPQ